MSTPNIDGEYPGSQSAVLLPIMQAVFADIQSRNIKFVSLAPSMTKFPPVETDPGQAYSLKIYDRFAHMVFSRWSPNAEVEVLFGTGGDQYGPKRVLGHMAFPSQWTDLLSLMAVYWITWQLSEMDLVPWNLQRLGTYYTSTIANPLYTNYLRTFCYTVLGIDENSFTSSTNNVGHATDYDDQ